MWLSFTKKTILSVRPLIIILIMVLFNQTSLYFKSNLADFFFFFLADFSSNQQAPKRQSMEKN